MDCKLIKENKCPSCSKKKRCFHFYLTQKRSLLDLKSSLFEKNRFNAFYLSVINLTLLCPPQNNPVNGEQSPYWKHIDDLLEINPDLEDFKEFNDQFMKMSFDNVDSSKMEVYFKMHTMFLFNRFLMEMLGDLHLGENIYSSSKMADQNLGSLWERSGNSILISLYSC